MAVVVKDEGAVRIVRMNRPDKKNAITAPMYDAMARAIVEAKSDRKIHCIVIAGAPGAFTAGSDLTEFQAVALGGAERDDAIIRFLHAIAHSEVPLVAAVDGLAVGIGTTMLLHCDYVVASAASRFSAPFVKLGLVPEAGSSLLAPRLMGHRRAFSLLVMGRAFDAAAARESGIVNEIVQQSEVEAAANKAAQEIAALPPDAVAASRRLMRPPSEVADRIDEEVRLFRQFMRSPDARAAFEKFFEGKK